jgi:hypothetical protein
MIRRGIALALALLVSTAVIGHTEAVAIDHKAVGCIVVGKYPKMNACFTPTAELARSRVYFRPEGVTSWYYVDMKSDQPCFTGTLPKPGKKLVGKKIEYYVEAQNKTFEPARTAEFAPVVVNSAQECKKNVPVAPFLNNATVAVFPSVPAGFVGASAIGTAAVVGIVGAGAAAAGTAVVVASNNDNNTTTTTPVAVNPTTTTTVVAVTTTTTTTTTVPANNKAPFAVLNTNPDPPSGFGPLTVTFDLCKSTDPENQALNFFFDFGDGGKASGSCVESHTYAAALRGASDARALDKSYEAQGCVVDPGGLSACRSRNVNITTVPPPTTTPACPTPTASIVNSGQFNCNVFAQVSVTNTDAVTVCATGPGPCGSFDAKSGAPPAVCAPASQDGDWFGNVDVPSNGCYTLGATATNKCGGSGSAAPVLINVFSCFSTLRKAEVSSVLWSSDLRLDGGRLQVVVNGSTSAYPERGRSFATTQIKDGDNRVEATVVQAAGKAGSWTIDLSASQAIQAGSIRVLAGEIESVGATAVTFKLKGTPGERLAFTFVKK